ncbi:MAG TPA: HD domain-containing protein [Acidimicrobiia bacterium]|nr:HD domain-containing protein [Acidimicrobiia bacterium]
MSADGDDGPSDAVVPRVQPGPRFAKAVKYAAAVHATQTRKGGDTPYLAHLLGVAALVLDHGGSETEAIGALLHDSIEDAGVTAKQLRKRFGPKVARIVIDCTDVRIVDGRDKRSKAARKSRDRVASRSAKNWSKRKRRSIRHLADPDTATAVLRVRAADLLWNARSINADLRRFGPEVWLRFHAGAVDQLWYYRSCAVVLSQRLPGTLTDELRVAVGEMERLAGWWFDVGDPQGA